MASYFLIQNYSAFSGDTSPAKNEKGPGFVLGDLNENQKKNLIEQGIIIPLEALEFTAEDRKQFIERHTHMIALLNKEQGRSLLWWATDLSSKNRYTSLVAVYIQELIEIISLVCRYPDQMLLIVDIAPALIPSLEQYSKLKGWVSVVRPASVLARLNVFIQRFKKMAAVVWFACSMYRRSLAARSRLKVYLWDQLKGKDKFYVIKTFSYDSSFDAQGAYKDAFFGRLPRDLKDQKNVLLLVNVLGDYQNFLQKASQIRDFTLAPLEFFLKGRDVFRAVIDVLMFRVHLLQPVHFGDLDVTSIIQYEIDRAFQGIDIQQFLHHDCVRRLLERVQIETFLMTCENNPWERMCTRSLRRYSPETKIIGYQHSVVPQAALNMFMDPIEIDSLPLPDKIITVGEITADMLRGCGGNPSALVHTGVALRYEYLADVKMQNSPWRGNLLVALDGVKQSAQLMEYVLRHCRDLPMQVIIRPHPALPRPYWENLYGRQMASLSHMRFSSQSLLEDLAWGDVLLYWQTTVVWEALKRGCPVINFSSRDILSFDPLMDCHHLRWEVGGHQSPAQALEKIRLLTREEKMMGWQKANDMVQKYFYPVREQYFKTFY